MATPRFDSSRAGWERLTFDHERAAAATAAERRRGTNSGAVDARNCRDSLRHISEELRRCITVGCVAAPSDTESDKDESFAHESGIHGTEAAKTLAKECRADEEETRERDLYRDQGTQDPLFVALRGATAPA